MAFCDWLRHKRERGKWLEPGTKKDAYSVLMNKVTIINLKMEDYKLNMCHVLSVNKYHR